MSKLHVLARNSSKLLRQVLGRFQGVSKWNIDIKWVSESNLRQEYPLANKVD